jgi:hypothetical protein
MNAMKKFVLIIFPVLLTAIAQAQTVKVQKESARIHGENMDGFEVTLEGTNTEVSSALNSYMKTMGKTRLKDDIITIQEPSVDGNKYSLPVYAMTMGKEKSSSAWVGIKTADWPEEDVKKVTKELEKTIYDFGVKFNRDKIQVQIDESARASAAVEKQNQRLANQNKELNVKLEDNKREKLQLEKSLENNALEYETLLKKIEKNKHDQDSVTLAGQQILKVTEMHKERQKKVN